MPQPRHLEPGSLQGPAVQPPCPQQCLLRPSLPQGLDSTQIKACSSGSSRETPPYLTPSVHSRPAGPGTLPAPSHHPRPPGCPPRMGQSRQEGLPHPSHSTHSPGASAGSWSPRDRPALALPQGPLSSWTLRNGPLTVSQPGCGCPFAPCTLATLVTQPPQHHPGLTPRRDLPCQPQFPAVPTPVGPRPKAWRSLGQEG